MQRWKQMLEQFLDRTFTAEEFVKRYLDYRREEMNREMQFPPDAQAELDALSKARFFRTTRYMRKLHELQAKYPLDPPSWVGHPIIEDVFWAVEWYWDDPETFDPKRDITEEQLREAAQKALDELNELSADQDINPHQ